MATTSLEERFASLEDSSRKLSIDVQALTQAISIVAEIQAEQRAMRRRQEEARAAIEEKQRVQDVRITRARRSASLLGITMAIVLPIVSILVYLTLINHVDSLLEEQRRDRAASCEARNVGTLASIKREQVLAELDENPAVQKAHLDSVLDLKKSLIDCVNSRPLTPVPGN